VEQCVTARFSTRHDKFHCGKCGSRLAAPVRLDGGVRDPVYLVAFPTGWSQDHQSGEWRQGRRSEEAVRNGARINAYAHTEALPTLARCSRCHRLNILQEVAFNREVA
jgi:hypothetical protein